MPRPGLRARAAAAGPWGTQAVSLKAGPAGPWPGYRGNLPVRVSSGQPRVPAAAYGQPPEPGVQRFGARVRPAEDVSGPGRLPTDLVIGMTATVSSNHYSTIRLSQRAGWLLVLLY